MKLPPISNSSTLLQESSPPLAEVINGKIPPVSSDNDTTSQLRDLAKPPDTSSNIKGSEQKPFPGYMALTPFYNFYLFTVLPVLLFFRKYNTPINAIKPNAIYRTNLGPFFIFPEMPGLTKDSYTTFYLQQAIQNIGKAEKLKIGPAFTSYNPNDERILELKYLHSLIQRLSRYDESYFAYSPTHGGMHTRNSPEANILSKKKGFWTNKAEELFETLELLLKAPARPGYEYEPDNWLLLENGIETKVPQADLRTTSTQDLICRVGYKGKWHLPHDPQVSERLKLAQELLELHMNRLCELIKQIIPSCKSGNDLTEEFEEQIPELLNFFRTTTCNLFASNSLVF